MTHTSTEQPEALRLAETWQAKAQREASRQNSAYDVFGMGNTPESVDPLGASMAAELRRLHARVQELEASQEHLKNALEDIASGEITRSHCVGPHCTEDVGLATADEMASRAAGALHWHGITQEKHHGE